MAKAKLSAKHRTGRAPTTSRRRGLLDKWNALHPDRYHRFFREDRVDGLADAYEYKKCMDENGGVVKSGKDVLMSCARADFNEREVERAELAEAARMGAIETFKTEASKHGVEVVNRSKIRTGPMKSVVPGAVSRDSDEETT